MLTKKEITALFNKFRSFKVLVIGDVMVDSYLWGKVERLSPEAPIPIVSLNKRENRLGGAANVALNVQALGAKPIMCSVIGNDTKGEEFIKLLKSQKLSDAGIIKSDKRITTTKFRVLGNNVQLLRVDEEVEHDISKQESGRLFNRIKELIAKENIKAIIFEDYDKGVIQPDLINKVVSLAVSRKIPVTVDPKKRNFSAYKNITLFKPNLKEVKEGLKIEINTSKKADLIKAVDLLHSKQNAEIVLLTLAAEGVFVSQILKSNSKLKTQNELISAHKRNIADVSGAGDTVISTATLCLAAGLSASDTARIANLAGGLVCEQVGVIPIDKNILIEAIYTDC